MPLKYGFKPKNSEEIIKPKKKNGDHLIMCSSSFRLNNSGYTARILRDGERDT